MIEHIRSQKMRAFCARALVNAEMAEMAEHLADCPLCRRLFLEVFQEMNDHQPVSLNLSPGLLFRHEHLDFDQLVSLADDNLDDEDKEIVNIHLRVCNRCREDVRSFMEFRRQIESAINISPVAGQPVKWTEKVSGWLYRPKTQLRPFYAVTIIVALGFTLLAFFLLRDGGKKDQRALTTPSPETITPSPQPSVTASIPAPNSKRGEEPDQISGGKQSEQPTPIHGMGPTTDKDIIASLRDGDRKIVVGRTGVVRGMEAIPDNLRQPIRDALLSQEIRKPESLNEIASDQGAARGNNDRKSPFRLLRPARSVIAEDRPVFEWQAVEGASNFEVQIADSRGREVANSGRLPASATQWTPATPLRRGVIYSWAVTAIINGQTVTSPAPTAPEMKFKILEVAKMRQLEQLRGRGFSHLALGVFYAREGMLAEAEREFQVLVNDNPDSQIAASMLRAVRSWR
jgi:predicted anti-sigma-YlaC factor YlaD